MPHYFNFNTIFYCKDTFDSEWVDIHSRCRFNNMIIILLFPFKGYYCLEGTRGIPTSYLLCSRGHFCPAETGDYRDNPCAAGKFQIR